MFYPSNIITVLYWFNILHMNYYWYRCCQTETSCLQIGLIFVILIIIDFTGHPSRLYTLLTNECSQRTCLQLASCLVIHRGAWVHSNRSCCCHSRSVALLISMNFNKSLFGRTLMDEYVFKKCKSISVWFAFVGFLLPRHTVVCFLVVVLKQFASAQIFFFFFKFRNQLRRLIVAALSYIHMP